MFRLDIQVLFGIRVGFYVIAFSVEIDVMLSTYKDAILQLQLKHLNKKLTKPLKPLRGKYIVYFHTPRVNYTRH